MRRTLASRIGWLALAITICAAPGLAAENGMRADALRCEGQENPLAVESPQPALTWVVTGNERSIEQTAYQILVARGKDQLGQDRGEVWDSGKVVSAAQRVHYAGPALTASSRVFWKVRLWDAEDRPGCWSDTAEWSMGLLEPADWNAKWLTAPQPPKEEKDLSKGEPLPVFRKEFTAGEQPLRRAMAYVCGLGHFELFVNGERIGDHVFDPGWTDYRDTCLYVPFDVTKQVQAGKNAVGVMLGNGMYNVAGGRYTKFKGSFGAPTMILHLRLEYADGSVERIVSDGTWRVDNGPITFSCVYGGEDYDARLEQHGWNTPGFDDSQWQAAQVSEGLGGALRAQSEPPIKVMETLAPVSMTRTAPGEYAVDLGYNLSARPVITVKGAVGSQVTVRVAERANQPWEGHSYTYTLRGGGEETYRPHFTYFGFQYVYVSGVDRPEDVAPESARPVLLDVGSDFVTSASPVVGAFECDQPLLNDIEAMINRSVRSNLQSVLTDCPHREKLGWLEVPHLMGPSILYHFDAAGLYRKICRDTSESQLDNGMVPDIAPEYTRFSEGFFESAEWGSASAQLPWLLYRWYGDVDTLTRQYAAMARYTLYLASTRNGAGLAKGGLGDWYDWTPEKGHAGYAQLTPKELTATAMLFDNARIMAAAAALLGKTDDAEAFKALAEQVRLDFMTAYYHAGTGIVATGSQAAQSVGLYFGLVPEEGRAAVLAHLVKALQEMNYRPATGEVCFRYMIAALAEAGLSEEVYRIINRTDPPGYGCMLRQYGLKTLSEQWDKPGSSLNHCMFGHIQEWFQGYVLGIRQAESSAGFERLRLTPTPVGDMHAARGYYDGPRGRIAIAWRKEGGNFSCDVTVPGNTAAEIALPVGNPANVMESEMPVSEARGVKQVRATENQVMVTVGSGTYRFRSNE